MAKVAQIFLLLLVVPLILVGCITFQERNASVQAYNLAKAHWIGRDAVHMARLEKFAKGFDLEVLSVNVLDMPEKSAGDLNYYSVRVVNPEALREPGSSTYNTYALVLRSCGTVYYLDTDEDVRGYLNRNRQFNPNNLATIMESIRIFALFRGYTFVTPLPGGTEIPEGVFQGEPSAVDNWSLVFRIQEDKTLSVFATFRTSSEFGVYERYRFDVSSNGISRVIPLERVWQDMTGFR